MSKHSWDAPGTDVSRTTPLSRSAMHTHLRVAIALMPLVLSGCLDAFPRPEQPAAQPELLPDVFFAGRTRGEGTLTMRFRAPRTLRVEGLGQRDPDGTFRLDQTVTFDDGTVDTRTWHMRRTAANQYRATLSDAAGEVTAETSGNALHLHYLLRQPAVYMDQWLYLQPDGRTVLNRATVTVLGIPWARLAETITRSDSSTFTPAPRRAPSGRRGADA